MKELYEVINGGFWHKGQWQAEGDTLRLTEEEAKYLVGHNVRKKTLPAPAPAQS